MNNGEVTLEMKGVTRRYYRGTEAVAALNGVDLTVRTGEIVALVGRSGSGKSTLLHLAGGLDIADEGYVRIQGTDPSKLSVGERAILRRRSIGFVFQLFHLLPTLSVLENVELPLLLDRSPNSRERAGAALESMELSDKLSRYPSELSGGEMQRAAVARALVTGAPMILADEPTGNLDSTTGRVVLELLESSVRESGATLVIVTHDVQVAARADRILRLADGVLVKGEGSESAGETGLRAKPEP